MFQVNTQYFEKMSHIMMYSEFVAGTGCKDNEHNYKVFQDLEIMYMNSNLTKNEIYEYGKKLVNNSKSEKEIKFEAEIKAQIEDLKETIRFYQEQLEMYKTLGWRCEQNRYHVTDEVKALLNI